MNLLMTDDSGSLDSDSVEIDDAVLSNTASLCNDIVSGVAEVRESDPTDLPLLHSAINAGAIAKLYKAGSTGEQGSVDIAFNYAGCRIVILSEGTILIQST